MQPPVVAMVNARHTHRLAVASEAICKWGHNFFEVPPLFSCAPHMRGQNDCLLPTERQLKCPLESAPQSAHLLVKSGEGQ